MLGPALTLRSITGTFRVPGPRAARRWPGDAMAIAVLIALPVLVYGVPALLGHPVLPGDFHVPVRRPVTRGRVDPQHGPDLGGCRAGDVRILACPPPEVRAGPARRALLRLRRGHVGAGGPLRAGGRHELGAGAVAVRPASHPVREHALPARLDRGPGQHVRPDDPGRRAAGHRRCGRDRPRLRSLAGRPTGAPLRPGGPLGRGRPGAGRLPRGDPVDTRRGRGRDVPAGREHCGPVQIRARSRTGGCC